MSFEYFEHTADIKFQASGKTIEKAFEQAAMALKQVIAEDVKVKDKINKEIKAKGKDKKALLYNFLEEFLYLLDAEDFLFSKVTNIKIKDNTLKANISGDKASNYKFTNDVKAITYNSMFIKKEKDKYVVQVVLDV